MKLTPEREPLTFQVGFTSPSLITLARALSTKADPAGNRSDPFATSATRSAAASDSRRRKIRSSAETFRRKFPLRRWSSSSPRTGKKSAPLRSFRFHPEVFSRPCHFRFAASPFTSRYLLCDPDSSNLTLVVVKTFHLHHPKFRRYDYNAVLLSPNLQCFIRPACE